MTTRWTLLATVILFPWAAVGAEAAPARASQHTRDAVVESIRARTAGIAAKEKSLVKRSQSVSECSTEGGELVAFRESGGVEKLVFRIFGESGRGFEEYYFDDRQLYFAHLVQEQYDAPLSGVVRERSDDQLYFDRGSLHLWLHGKVTMSPSSSGWTEKAREVIEDARNLLAGSDLPANNVRCARPEALRLVESRP